MASDAPYISANGARVTSLDLAVPFYGIPVADIALSAGSLLANPITLRVGNASFTMALAKRPDGSIAQASFAGSTTARLVGGAGTWSTAVSLPPYSNPGGVMLSTVLRDLATATGTSAATRERVSLASGLDRSLGVFYVPEPNAPAARLLSLLAGRLWWMGADGVTRVASTRTAAAIGTPATVENYSGSAGWVSVATEDPAAWMPGATFTSAQIPNGVTVAASRLRAGNDGVLRVEVLVQ